jgi:hypothetical protein
MKSQNAFGWFYLAPLMSNLFGILFFINELKFRGAIIWGVQKNLLGLVGIIITIYLVFATLNELSNVIKKRLTLFQLILRYLVSMSFLMWIFLSSVLFVLFFVIPDKLVNLISAVLFFFVHIFLYGAQQVWVKDILAYND